jgi:hypothetical protein
MSQKETGERITVSSVV